MNLIDKNSLFLLEEIIKKNFSVKYKGSILGILWSVLKPLFTMILLTIIFSTLFNKSIENYPVYMLSGRIMLEFFNQSTNTSLRALKSNIIILKTTPAPKFIFVLGGVVSEFIDYIIEFIILLGVMVATNATFYPKTSIFAIIPLLSLIIMCIGIGLILSVLCIYFSDIQHLWSVVTLMIMYASAIFYPMDIIPEPYHQLLILSPVYWAIDQFRHLLVWGTFPDPLNMINLILISLIIFVIGIIVFEKYEKKITLKF